jgi:hypothetical protein
MTRKEPLYILYPNYSSDIWEQRKQYAGRQKCQIA